MSPLRYASTNNEPTTLGTGQGNSKGSDAGRGYADQVKTRKKALPASFETFKEAVEILNQVEDVQAHIRSIEGAIEYIPLTKPANQRQWSYLDSSTLCRRQVIIADICYQKRWCSLIEFEMRKSESCTVALVGQGNGEYSSNHQLNNLLFQLANKKGIWLNIPSTLIQSVNIKTMKHTWSTPLDFKRSIIERL